jgi:predicted NAD/FAD-dependent oxidoreductase
MSKPKIAIVGAGISAAILTYNLAKVAEVHVYDKARGPGGRCSSRRFEDINFDHGASYFKLSDEDCNLFKKLTGQAPAKWQIKSHLYLKDLENQLNLTSASAETVYLMQPRMNSLIRDLLTDNSNSLNFQTRIEHIRRDNDKYKLIDDKYNVYDDFEQVFVTAPPAQAAQMLSEFTISENINRKHDMYPDFVMMLATRKRLEQDFDIAKIKNSMISEVIAEHRKPAKDFKDYGVYTVRLHRDYTFRNVDKNPDKVLAATKEEFSNLFKYDLTEIVYESLHRWLYSGTSNEKLAGKFLQEDEIYIVGDWLAGNELKDSLQVCNSYLKALAG